MTREEPPLADRVVRTADGGIALRLVDREREILRALLVDLAIVVAAPPFPDDEWDDDPWRSETAAAALGDPGVDDVVPGGAPEEDAPGEELFDETLDDIRARLYPSAVPDNPRADASYRRLVHADLEAGRRERLAVVEATLDARSLDDAQAEAWVQTLNDLRLVLGTRLEVTEASEGAELDPEDPQAAARILYAYTGWLEGQFVDVLADALPDVPDPDDAASDDDATSDDDADPDDDAIAADDS